MRYDQLKVLLVDDNRYTRVLLGEILRAVGTRMIHEAGDGAEGLKLMAARHVDVVITDLNMEPMNALDFVKQLRASHGNPNQFAPVIMVTGNCTVATVNEARDAGVNEFMAKPFNARAVLQRLQLAVERPRAFVQQDAYIGPDRRRREEPGLKGLARRPGDPGRI